MLSGRRFPLVLLLVLSACESNSTRHTDMTTRLAALDSTVAELSERLRTVEWRNALDDAYEKERANARFDPAAAQGFARLETSVGSFAVALREVKPYADGVRAVLDVGNLTTAKVRGATFKVKWGPRLSGGRLKEWEASLQQRDIEILKDLEPGRWNQVVLSLPDTEISSLGYIEVGMETSEISLIRE